MAPIGNPTWSDWSQQAIASTRARGPLLINAIVYAEFAIGFEAQSDCDAEIERFDLVVAEMPVSAAFRAAQAFRLYRRSGGVRTSALPDFFIGAHASVAAAPLLTRDVRRYRAYFPELTRLAREKSACSAWDPRATGQRAPPPRSAPETWPRRRRP